MKLVFWCCLGCTVFRVSVTAEDSATLDSPLASKALPAIELPFDATRVAMSEDGTHAAIWDQTRRGSQQNLAVLDLDRMQLIAQKIFSTPFSDVVVGEAIYVAHGRTIERLSVETLEVEHSFEAAAAVSELNLLADRTITGKSNLRLAAADLMPLLSDTPSTGRFRDGYDGRCGFGWISKGILWDHSLTVPRLLVMPDLFRTGMFPVSLADADEPRLTVNSWHPFGSESNASPSRRTLVTAESPHIAATLAVVPGINEYHIASFRLDNGEYIASVAVAAHNTLPDDGRGGLIRPRLIPGSDRLARAHEIVTGKKRFATLLLGRLYVGSLDLLQPVGFRLPFHIDPRQNKFVLSLKGATTFRYDAEDATRFRISSHRLSSPDQPFIAQSDTGEFTISVSEHLDALLTNTAAQIANHAHRRLDLDNQQYIENYATAARTVFRQVTGREAKGIPLPIDIQVNADGRDFDSAGLRHDFFVELPLQSVVEALDRASPATRNSWKPPAKQWNLNRYPADASPPSGADTMAKYMRGVWALPAVAIEPSELATVARLAKLLGDERLRQRYNEMHAEETSRAWTDTNGQTIQAILVQVFAGQVMLRTESGAEITLNESSLNVADREYLSQAFQSSSPRDDPVWHRFVFANAVRALHQFHDTYHAYPPFALCDQTGQPRLSWRVLILPALGYPELFSLFHLDEPWNSHHNLAISPYLPSAYVLSPSLARTGKTTLVSILSPLSVIPTMGMAKHAQFRIEAPATIVFAEADPTRGVEWTKPADPQLYELSTPSNVVRARENSLLVGLLDGRVAFFPASSSPEIWRQAINRGDQLKQLEGIEPPTD